MLRVTYINHATILIQTDSLNILTDPIFSDYAGDTGYGSFLNELHQRFPEFRLTVFPIGSYEKRWFMKKQHMNPDDAVKAHLLLNSKQSIGMHFATFVEHPEQTIDQHEKDMEIAVRDYKLPKEKFVIPKFGEGLFFP